MRSRLLLIPLATFLLAACGGRQAAPIAAEPIDARPTATSARASEPLAASRPATPPRAMAGKAGSAKVALKPAPAGVHHVLERGQTLYSLARLYDVPLKTLMSANGITDPTSIRAGTKVFVPGATALRDYATGAPVGENRADAGDDDISPRPAVREAGIAGLEVGGNDTGDAGADTPDDGDADEVDHEGPEDDGSAPRRHASNVLAWPLHGAITGPYGRRGKHGHHAGIDIDGQSGDPILAAASGVVTEAGMGGPYGRRVVIDHGDGWTTLYAHAERLLVHEGETVHVGQRIALVGRSGNARGSHLHFEVRHDGRTVNPTSYLAGDRLLTAGVQ